MRVGLQKRRGNGMGITQRGNTGGRQGPANAVFVDDNADDLDVGSPAVPEQPLENLLAVGHLRHIPRGNEANSIKVTKAQFDQTPQVTDFVHSRNYAQLALPGVAWAFDKFYTFRHGLRSGARRF